MKSGRKTGIGLLVTFLILVGILVLADRGAAWAAESKISDQVAQKAAEKKIEMEGKPDVTIEGFPFLTQVIGGEFQAVDIKMRKLSLDGVSVDSLDVRATDVKADIGDLMNGKGDVRAGEVTGKATVAFDQVEELVGMDGAKVRGKDGKLLITVPVSLGPTKVTALATARVKVYDGGIKIQVDDVSVKEADLPSSLRSEVASSLSRRIALPALPYGLKVRGATVADDGIVAMASAQDVPLTS